MMLTQKQQDMPYIGIFKISTGEEVITTVLDQTLTSLTIKNPLCMVPTQKGYQFAPLLIMADPDKTSTLYKTSLVASTEPSADLESQYQSVTTGIALPQKSKIIT